MIKLIRKMWNRFFRRQEKQAQEPTKYLSLPSAPRPGAKRLAKLRAAAYKRRYGRSTQRPHIGVQQTARTQRRGSPAWYGWQEWRRQHWTT